MTVSNLRDETVTLTLDLAGHVGAIRSGARWCAVRCGAV